jgi:hypothetical protein
MSRRHLLLLALAIALFLAPIAGASMVPDPTWIAGLYDGGDNDELAILWENTAGVVPAGTVPLMPVVAFLDDGPTLPPFVSRPLPRFASRAPPQV